MPRIWILVKYVGPRVLEWAKEIVDYLEMGKLPEEAEVARKIRKKVSRFVKISEALYAKGFTTPLLRCISPEEAHYVLTETPKGVCGNHSNGKALERKALRAGYYWLNTLKDAKQFARRCTQCQVYAPIPHCPPE